MKSSKFWIAVVVTGIVGNILDFVVQGMILTNMYYSTMPDIFNNTTNPAWYIFGDFVGSFVLIWFYDKVRGSFAEGMKGGATFGFYAGVLLNFPTWIFIHLFIKGYPYGLSWIDTIYGIIWYIIAGAIIGGLYSRKASTAPAQ